MINELFYRQRVYCNNNRCCKKDWNFIFWVCSLYDQQAESDTDTKVKHISRRELIEAIAKHDPAGDGAQGKEEGFEDAYIDCKKKQCDSIHCRKCEKTGKLCCGKAFFAFCQRENKCDWDQNVNPHCEVIKMCEYGQLRPVERAYKFYEKEVEHRICDIPYRSSVNSYCKTVLEYCLRYSRPDAVRGRSNNIDG